MLLDNIDVEKMPEVPDLKYQEPPTKFIDDSIVTMAGSEAVSTVMDINGEPMKVFICTDKIITENHLKPVTNSIAFLKANIPTPDGIFSEQIFGSTQTEKILNHAYIDLHRKFFHPFVYEVLTSQHSKIKQVVTGEKIWTIKDGKLVEVKDETDPDYDPNNTGLDFIIRRFRDLKFEINDSIGHNNEVEFIRNLSDNEIFITKYCVIPRFYRDYSANGKMTSVDPINNLYNKLIGLSNSLQSGIVGYIAHKTMNEIQNILVQIRKHGQTLIEKKEGHIHRSVLGRNTTYGARGVISVPSLVGCDYPDDCQVNMLYTGLPLSKCLETGYPFIIKYLLDWVAKEASGGEMSIYRKGEDGMYHPDTVRLRDHTSIMDKSYLDKRIQMFRFGFGGRMAPIELQTEDGEKVYCAFRGHVLPGSNYEKNAATIGDRPMTWADLMYLAAEDMLGDKHIYSTRYPGEDYFNIIPTRIAILSTLKTVPMMVNGKIYKHYPVINPFADESTVSRSFIDTILPSNLHLAGYRGDYDGDTVSIRMCYTQEANVEAEAKIMALTNYMTINGNLIRVLGNESTLCMYNMTRRDD